LLIFHVDVACNTNASDVCEIMFAYLLTCVSQHTIHKCAIRNHRSDVSGLSERVSNSAWPSLRGQAQWVPAKGRRRLAAGE